MAVSLAQITSKSARRAVRTVVGPVVPSLGQKRHASLAAEYRVTNLVERDGAVPLVWWPVTPNFGDLLSPWLFEKITGKPVVRGTPDQVNYVSIGSVLKRVTPKALVWGTGSFGNEQNEQIELDAEYFAVRGPLTRARLVDLGASVPKVYGDPGLLAPVYYWPDIPKTHEIGVVVRWSEGKWKEARLGPGVKLIDLGTDRIEDTIDAMLACKRIVTSSLHGLVISDAYGIPAAWLESGTPNGRDYKFHDYALSVNKHREPKRLQLHKQELTVKLLRDHFDFDSRAIEWSPRKLLDAAPFLSRR